MSLATMNVKGWLSSRVGIYDEGTTPKVVAKANQLVAEFILKLQQGKDIQQ